MHAEHAPLWVKICGLVEPETAEAAAASGASAIGLNFYPPSKRSVSATQARMICEQAALGNGCLKIGLFVNASMAEVHTVLATVPLDALQFHGDESSEYCRQFDLPVIKVIGVDTQDLQANAARDAEIDEQADDTFESDAPETVSAASDEHEMNAENMTDFPLASASEAPSNVQTSAVEREADIESEVDELEASMGDSVADEAEVNRTRLSLAAAYIEMGDPRAAKEILNDVLQEGNADQRSQAQELLDELEKPE